MAVREGDPLSTGHACDGITNLAISLKKIGRASWRERVWFIV